MRRSARLTGAALRLLLAASAMAGSLSAQYPPPVNISVSPSSGPPPDPGSPHSFVSTASSQGGYSFINVVYLLFGWQPSLTDSCQIAYVRDGNYLTLMNDAGTQWLSPTPPGTQGATISNSNCTVDAGASSVSGAGNNLSVTVKVTFKQQYVGPHTSWMGAVDNAGLVAGWQAMGTWTGLPPAHPDPPDVTYGVSGVAGNSGNFSVTATDLNGWNYIRQIFLSVNDTLVDPHACLLGYVPYWNGFYLMNDAGTQWMGPQPPAPGVCPTASAH
jgi:hypothetical protein